MAKFTGDRYKELTALNIEIPTHLHSKLTAICSKHKVAKTVLLNAFINALATGDVQIASTPKITRGRGVFMLDKHMNLNDVLDTKFSDKQGKIINTSDILEK